jgi:hypothetical protein
MIRKGLRPRFRLGLDRPDDRAGFREVLPFRRSWIAIGLLAVFDVIFIIPAVITFREAASMWSRPDDLFDVVGALFTTFWLMGWSIAPIALTTILAVVAFGREVVRASPGRIELFLGLPFVGLFATYDPSKMRNLRLVEPPKKSGKSWRGTHAVFDYGANTGEFGSDLDEAALARIKSAIEGATGVRIGHGLAPIADLEGEWETDPIEELTAIATAPAAVEAPAASAPLTLTSPSTLVLIAANLVPVIGTLFWGWNLGDVMVLYWAETAVIGFFNLCKIAVIGRWMALLAGPFFIGHFGGFMAVHFLFLYTLFIQGPSNMDSGGDLADVAKLFVGLGPALLALFLSHGYSFLANFLGRREFRSRTVQNQMSEPYSRIVFMHLVLIFGGGLTLVLGEPTPVLVIVIALKVFFDIRAHVKQREKS